jgi:hypothetical protein
MSPDLTGVELKLRRAETHLAHLNESMQARLHPDSYRLVVKHNPQTGEHVYSVNDLPPLDAEWAVVAGEILFNLRSALDHLAWQLVRLDGGTPGDKTQFPVRESPFNKKGDFIGVDLVPPLKRLDIRDALEKCQPYDTTLAPQHGIDQNPLWRLHRLNIIDKHRLLLVVVHVLDQHRLPWWEAEQGDPRPEVRLNQSPLEDGSPIAWFDFHGAEPPANFNPRIAFAVALNEPEFPGIPHIPLTEILTGVCWWVRWFMLTRCFRPLFGNTA